MAKRYGISSSVEWADVGITPIRGKCPYAAGADPKKWYGCEYCYMRQIFRRFEKSKKPLNPELRLSDDLYWSPGSREPLKVAVCLNLDMFHPDIPDDWIRKVIAEAWLFDRHTFMFLTKQPQRYAQFEFLHNSWLGTTWDGLPYTAFNVEDLARVAGSLARSRITFVSFEPLLSKPPAGILSGLPNREEDQKPPNWIIIGADSRRGAKKPPIEWADQLIEEAREIGAAVWVKDNYYGFYKRIKEYPLSGIAARLKEIGVGFNYGYDSDYFFP